MILYILGILIYVVPGLWVNYTLNKHDDVLPNMPFTAKEFGLNLLKEQNLEDVNIEDTKIGDHYDTNSKTVRVKQDRLDKKSITSITVMCHEIGHAIQHKENYPPLTRRQKVISKTELTEHIYDQDFDLDSNVIEVFVGRLRKKLDPAGNLKPIETLRGRGYRINRSL